MSDACFVCQCEAVDTEDWYFNKKTQEYVCPFCVKDMLVMRDGLFDISVTVKRNNDKND